MRRPSRNPEADPLRYDYQMAHEALTPRAEKRKWARDYDLCLFERIVIALVLFGPAVFAYWWFK